MLKRHTFRPESLGPLESRIALSGASAAFRTPAAMVHASAVRAKVATSADRATRTFKTNFPTEMTRTARWPSRAMT